MWAVVMFDLPVKTKTERRAATRFRELLLDLGYWMAQYSVYVRYTPTAASGVPALAAIRRGLPPQGHVRIVQVTDRQWAKGLRFSNVVESQPESAPAQLTIL